MINSSNTTIEKKSEILFLYESSYSIPNGDPFTGEQRYDEETKKVLVSDVRIKRFIRDFFLEINNRMPEDSKFEIYVWNDISQAEGKESGSSARMKALKLKFKDDPSVVIKPKGKDDKQKIDAVKLLQKCIDVRLFGGISTEEGDAVNLTGPVQFALLNPSLNEAELRMHQNTSVFVSSVEKSRGAIGTTTVVPYCVNQIHGWINPFSAKYTALTDSDVDLMLKALWESVNMANTRSKSNQSSLLLLQIIYAEPTKKVYGVDRLVKINPKNDMRGDQLRSFDDFSFDFSDILKLAKNEMIEKIRYYTEIESIQKQLQLDDQKEKLAKLEFENKKQSDEVVQ